MIHKYKYSIPQIKCNDDIATGFFITKDLILTAKHAIFEHLNDSKIPIEVVYKNNEGKKHTVYAEPVYSTQKSINEMEIIALRLKSPLDDIVPLDCISFDFENSINTITFGYPAVRMNEGTIIELNLVNIMNDGKADLKIIDRIQSYKGCSGGPLIYGQYVIGVVNSQTSEDGVASRLDGILLNDYEFYFNELGLELLNKELDIYKFEERLLEVTSPSISLNFFDYEDEDFEESFLNLLRNERTIYLQGKTKEEVLGYILFILKTKGKEFIRKVKIVNSIDEWNTIGENTENKILIPNFNAIEISSIPRNTNIIIYSEEDFTSSKVHLKLQKRTLNNMFNKLSREIDDVILANQLVKESNGLYSIFKRKVFNGKNGKPKWEGFNNRSLTQVLLTGAWEENSKDKSFLELFLNESYEQYINHLKSIINGEDPFILNFNSGYRNIYKIANIEESWEILGNTITRDQLTLFKEKSLEVLSSVPRKYTLPLEDHFHAELITKKEEEYSVTLKRGISRSLVALALKGYENGVDFQRYVDDIFTSLLSQVSRLDQFIAITDYMDLIVEASPKVFINFLEKEVNNEQSKIWSLFETNGDALFAKNYYTNILWGIEKLLCLEECVVPAIKILVKLSERDIEYKISNSPFNTLSHALLDWVHVINIPIEEKIELVEYVVENSTIGWKLLESILPTRRSRVVSNMARLKYRPYKFVEELQYQDQLYETQKAYYEIAINNAKEDFNKWILIFEEAWFFELGLQELVIETFKQSIKREISDDEIYSLKEKLRNIIHKHRYFKDSDWSMREEYISVLEELFNLLRYKSNAFSHLYLFTNYKLLDLNPIPYNKELKSDWESERESLYNKQVEVLKEILSGGIESLWELIHLLRKYNNDGNSLYIIGKILAEEIFDLQLNKDLIIKMKENNAKEVLIAYLNTLYVNQGFEIIRDSLSIIENEHELLLKVLSLCNIDNNFLLTLDEQHSEVIQSFWVNFSADRYHHNIEENLVNLVWDKLWEYRNYNALLNIVDIYFKNDIEKNIQILDLILNNQEDITINSFNSQIIIKLFKNIHEKLEINRENELYFKIYQLEWAYFDIINDWLEPKFLMHELKTNPLFLAHLIKLIYKSSIADQEDESEEKENMGKSAWRVLYKLKFCPCITNEGKVNEDELETYVKVFLKEVDKSGHEFIGRRVLGGCFAHSPQTDIFPCESVCKVFEKYYTKEMEEGFILEIRNSRGVYTITDGKEEEALALKYENFYKKIRMRYDKVSRVLLKISEIYIKESKAEREESTYWLR